MNPKHPIVEEIRAGTWAGLVTGCVVGLMLGITLVTMPHADLVIRGIGSITATLLLLAAGGAVLSAVALLPLEICVGSLRSKGSGGANLGGLWFYVGSVLIGVAAVYMGLDISFNQVRNVASPRGLGLLIGVSVVALLLWLTLLFVSRWGEKRNHSQRGFKAIASLFAAGCLIAVGAHTSLISARHALAPIDVSGDREFINPVRASGEVPRGSNVLLISIDTLRADHLSGYGYPRRTSPNIDTMALDGARFVRAHSQAPWTLPSHGTMMTSLYPSSHGARFKNNFRFLDAFYADRLDDSNLTLPELLKAAGYRTGALTSVNWLSPAFGFGQGFDTFDMDGARNSAAVLVDKAIEWISAVHDAPFFLFVHFFDVHNYESPDRYDALYQRGDYRGTLRDNLPQVVANSSESLSADDLAYLVAKYDGAINYVDAELGRLFQSLRSSALYDDTLIVLTSDHGEEFWDHGGTGHGFTLYQEQLRVPLIVKPPSAFPVTARESDALAGVIDVPPTILDYLGLPRPRTFEGISLRTVIEGERGVLRELFAEDTYFFNSYAVLDAGFKSINNRMLPPDLFNPRLLLANIRSLYRIRDDEFYNLELDPVERHNVSKQESVLQTAMTERMREHLSFTRLGEMKTLDPKSAQELRSLGYIR